MEAAQYTEILGQALEAVQEEKAVSKDDGLIHLSTGVVLSPRKVTPFIFQEVANRFVYPKIPKFYNEDKGREEENPMHPDYIQECATVDTDRATATIDATIALGTKLISTPPDFPSLDEDDWLDDLDIVGIQIDRNNKRLRYRTWVKYVAAPSVEDIQLIITKVLSAIGVAEEEVAKATANFQRPA